MDSNGPVEGASGAFGGVCVGVLSFFLEEEVTEEGEFAARFFGKMAAFKKEDKEHKNELVLGV